MNEPQPVRRVAHSGVPFKLSDSSYSPRAIINYRSDKCNSAVAHRLVSDELMFLLRRRIYVIQNSCKLCPECSRKLKNAKIANALQVLMEFLNLNYYNSFIQFGVASFQRRDGGFSFDDSRYPRYKLVGVAKGKGVAGANCARDRENKLSPVAATGMADARCGKVRRDERPVSHPGTSPPTSLFFFSTTNVSRHAVREYLVTVVSRARYCFISHYRLVEHLTDADYNHYSSSERRPRLCNCGVIFVSGKSQVIMRSGDYARTRGIEGQVIREKEKEKETEREIGRGCCMDCIVSELVQHCTKRLMMHLGILVEPIERWRVLGERLTLALRAVHSYSAGQVSSLKVATKYFFSGTVSLARPPKGIRKFLLLRVEPTFSGPSGMFHSAEVETCAASFRFSPRSLVHALMDEYVVIDLIFLAEFHPAKTCIYDTLSLWNAAGIFREINIDGFESTDTHDKLVAEISREDAGEPTLLDREGFLFHIGYGPMYLQPEI
ncbi:hypothetical protein G5I_12987 [Acromyrmex echinatior]|uniref:Uncharacterized protein n=1 Tax=Acromyrmex echinatior TaxID=103372 RepID=F4X3S4_ACREC|nr:hypothetical protein G5I_12987 [Acromyrmex echinatior]